MHQFTVMEDLSLYANHLALRIFSFHIYSTCSTSAAGNQCLSESGRQRKVGGVRHTWWRHGMFNRVFTSGKVRRTPCKKILNLPFQSTSPNRSTYMWAGSNNQSLDKQLNMVWLTSSTRCTRIKHTKRGHTASRDQERGINDTHGKIHDLQRSNSPNIEPHKWPEYCLSLIIIICFTLHNNYMHTQIQKKNPITEILHEHIRESIPIVYTFYGRYNIDRTTEGPYLLYDYAILTLSPGVSNYPTCLPHLITFSHSYFVCSDF